jgi:hypothetical protein
MEESGKTPAAEEPEVSAVDPGVDAVDTSDDAVDTRAPMDAETGEPEESAEPATTAEAPDANEPPVQPTLDEMVAQLTQATPLAAQGESAGSVQPAQPATPVEVAEAAAAIEAAEASQSAEPAATPEPESPEPAETPGSEETAEVGGGEPVEVAVEAAEIPAEVAAEPLPPLVRRTWTRVPMWVAAAVSFVFVGAMVYLLWPAAAGGITSLLYYRLLVFGGAGLVLVDLVTGCVVWLVARSRAEDDDRAGLAGTLWMRALMWTAVGVGFWWIGFLLLDLRHSGVL